MMRPELTASRLLSLVVPAVFVMQTQASVQDLQADRADPVSTSLVILNGFLVFFMQVGFLAYETGSGRAKNVRNILLKNLLDVMIAAIVWWAVGYAFAYGESAKGVIGTNMFFYEGQYTYDKAIRPWFFSWTFCIAACAIISGCLAERTALAAYPIATLLISGLVHPLLVHWMWSPSGWMSNISECQVLDFAGGLLVHMLGGLFGLIGAWKCGPRLGRFELADSEDHDNHTVHSASDPTTGSGPAAGSAMVDGGRMSWEQYLSVRTAALAEGGSSSLPTISHASSSAAAVAAGAGPSSSTAAGCSYPGLPGGARLLMNGTPAAGAPGTGARKSLEVVAAEPAEFSTSAELSTTDAVQSPAGTIKQALQHRWQRVKQVGVTGAGKTAGLVQHHQGLRPVRCRPCHVVPKPMPGHDMAFVTLGTFMLWFGWFGFNNGSVYMYVSGNSGPGGVANVSAEVVQRTSMNTALGGASGGLTALLMAAVFSGTGTYDLRICCNGVLSGLVTVTCMCGFVDPWAAVVCSAIAGALYTGFSRLLLLCGIDDPLDSSAVHLGNGLLGTILLAFFAKPEHVMALTGSPCGGVFYGRSGWLQLGLQLMGVAVVVVFAGGCAWVMFIALDRYHLLRVDQVTELAGIDNMDHGGPAYPEGGGNTCMTSPAQNSASAGRRML